MATLVEQGPLVQVDPVNLNLELIQVWIPSSPWCVPPVDPILFPRSGQVHALLRFTDIFS